MQVPVASWFDDMTDSELLDLIPFFEKLSKMDNVYTVLCNSNRPYNSSSMSASVGGGTTNNVTGTAAAAVTNNASPPTQQQGTGS